MPLVLVRMNLIPKDVDNRGLLKALLSKTYPGKSSRFLKVVSEVRKKFGDQISRVSAGSKNDKYYLKLSELFICGKYGQVETDQDGEKRYRPFFCNIRKLCFECFNRYKEGLKWVYLDKVLEVARATSRLVVVFPTYTLHPEIRQAIPPGNSKASVDFLNELTRLWVDSFKQAIGIGKHRGRDITGIISVAHAFNSSNPFKDQLHWHGIWIPLKITEDGKLKQMRSWVDVDKARALWQGAQEQFAKNHGFTLAGSETNLKIEYIHLDEKAKIHHKMSYIFRSQLKDIFLSVRYITEDLEGFLWLEDKSGDWLPHVERWEVLERTMERYMNYPVKIIKSYGFFRNLKKHAEVLGLKQVLDKPPFVLAYTVKCEFRRLYESYFDKAISKNVLKLTIEVKHDERPWHKVELSDVVGETCSNAVKYKWIRGP